jgi:hypothetical protein
MLRSADLVTVSRVGFPKMEMALIQEVEGQPPVQVIKGISKKAWIDFTGGKEKNTKATYAGKPIQASQSSHAFLHYQFEMV